MLIQLFLFAIFDLILYSFLIIGTNAKYVTYESMVKLKNERVNYRLHSHEVRYNTGSGQQSVTGNVNSDDDNSYWIIKSSMDIVKNQREAVRCGSVIRLQHHKTKKNLHSHIFLSPISGEYEVSCFGENGLGDSGDHWIVICDTKYWLKGKDVSFQHVDTKKYLTATENRFGRPISGQYEIVGKSDLEKYYSKWRTAEGVYFKAEMNNIPNSKDEL